ncbi:MAG: FHA domain-containing protein [Planctomycetes bacterium]|nr:FHA domain-containing protein [Planctomycetota bacterium]
MRLIYRRGREDVAFPIEEGETYIGRKDYCELFFPDGSLSKRHARLVRRGSKLKVFDAGSRNGTLVNGELIEEARLHEGDIIQCGKLKFRVAGVGGPSGEDYEYVEERGGRTSRKRSRASEGSLLVTARAVASVDARASMLDVLPELPPSLETEGYGKDSLVDDPYADEDEGPETLGAIFRLTEGGPPKTWELTEETITIGSKEENAIVLTGDGVSRYHAEVVYEDGVWIVKDLGARNGLFVAGEKVDIYELKDGDEIQIGSSRLRFEVKKPDPLAEVKAVAKALFEDPKGTLKTDARARMAVVAIVFIVATGLLSLFAPGRKAPTGTITGEAAPPWAEEVSRLMIAGKFSEARSKCRNAKAALKSLEQKNPRHLERMCNLWGTLEGDPAGFSWNKAERQLAGTAKLKGIPPPLRAWFSEQEAYIKLSKRALKGTLEARGQINRAERLIAEGELEPALELLAAAGNEASKVPAGTPFSKEARTLSKRVRRTAFRALIREAKKVTSQTPDWGRGLKLLRTAKEYADGDDDRSKVGALSGRYERNWKDEQAYMRGVDVIQAGQPERYDAAREYFKEVHPRSRVYRHAVAYLQWIDADEDVRRAQTAYDDGDHRRAFQLLSDAFNHESLDKPAKESVRHLHIRWSRVVGSYDRGLELKNKKKHKEAIVEFEQVLKSEPNARNSLHVRARKEIQLIIEIEGADYKRKLTNLRSAYKKENWGAFHTWALEVTKDKNRRQRDVDWIFKAADDANKKFRLYKRCYRAFQHDDEDKFVWSEKVLVVLANWLPLRKKGKINKERKKAKELWTKIKARIQRWRLLQKRQR